MDFKNDENLDYQLNKIAASVIKEKRLAKGYSLEELSNKLNNIVTRQSLFRYESNEARMKNNIFKKICLALDEDPTTVWNEINSRLLNNLSLNTTSEESPNNIDNDLQILFINNKDLLTKDDEDMIRSVIEKRIKNKKKEIDEKDKK